jgi:hypothetical protein
MSEAPLKDHPSGGACPHSRAAPALGYGNRGTLHRSPFKLPPPNETEPYPPLNPLTGWRVPEVFGLLHGHTVQWASQETSKINPVKKSVNQSLRTEQFSHKNISDGPIYKGRCAVGYGKGNSYSRGARPVYSFS